ncbi:MAG TPA: filamentous hemagglutinin N-terminal domain-containing protein, partial [Gammaproteobacteria bacterium]|nr:filamentous hemagglutinin N-terminal domain-containing protein [Gammaproteobacteria bacterium]
MSNNFKNNLKFITRHVFILISTIAISEATLANPEGGVVAAGSATISQSPGLTHIEQSSEKAIINWQSFNINAAEKTHFQQPVHGIALNRINPHMGASQIYGQLTATGKIILVNQAGIFFGPGSFVDVGGIIASTSDISDANFLAGKYHFDKPSEFNGSVINQGTIRAAQNGLVALVGQGVRNDGLIEARMGNVVLGSGNKFTIDLYGDQLINFSVDEASSAAGIDHQGKKLTAGVENNGKIIADGGKILISARSARNVVDNVINMRGVAQAKGVYQHGGEIILSGEGGTVRVSGKIIATGKRYTQRGGKVKISGDNIVIESPAEIDVSGSRGGGEILIGGDYQGKAMASNLPNAKTTYVEQGVNLKADAINQGDGGKIIVWGDDATFFHGNLFARGGQYSGNGGFVETSGHYLDVTNASINLLAPYGKAGTWLLDPIDVTISNSAASNSTYSNGGYGFSANPANILASQLMTALQSGNVSVSTSGTTGGGNGDIAVNAALTWDASTTLTLFSVRNIYLNADITAYNGGLSLTAINGAQSMTGGTIGSGTIGGAVGTLTANINVKDFTLSQGQWFQRAVSLPVLNVSNNFTIAGGSTYNGNYAAQFTRLNTTSGTGGITDVFGLQGVATGTLSTSYSIANNIDASKTLYWNSGAGFNPIGTDATNKFTGGVTGQNFVIDSLYINRPSTTYVGLFGVTNAVSGIGLTNVSITGGLEVGALAGRLDTGDISNSYSTGKVVGTLSSSTSGTGGLVGTQPGGSSILTSYSGANVYGVSNVGGLVGYTNSALGDQDVYAYGNVTGTSNVGGLVGKGGSNISIDRAYSSGQVKGTSSIGGLIGVNLGSTLFITNSFWDVTTSGLGSDGSTSGSAGGTGKNTANMTTAATFSGSTWNITSTIETDNTQPATTWFIFPSYTRPILMMEFSTSIKNPHQLQLAGTTLNANYTLANDIDMTSVRNPSDIWATTPGSTTSNTSIGFIPIGYSSAYTGTFNGQGNFIKNLYINTTNSNIATNIGLFSSIGNGSTGTVQNVYLSNVEVRTNNQTTGGLVGLVAQGGLVSDSGVTSGSVLSNENALGVGGLVGINREDIRRSYSGADVSGQEDVGGLVGINNNSTGISSLIDNSYAYGTVSGRRYAGGLVGNNGDNSGGTAAIQNSWSSGLVISTNAEGGGLIAHQGASGASTSNSYWDTQTSGQASSASGTGLTTSQMMTQSNFSGWDFSTVWFIPNYGDTTLAYTRPLLRSEASTSIRNAHQLQLVASGLSASYTLANDIDMKSAMNNASDVWGTVAKVSGAGFVPIGNGANSFTGSFNGNNDLIDNLYMNNNRSASYSSQDIGLFAKTNGSTLRNIGLTNVDYTAQFNLGSLTVEFVGALVGTDGSTTFNNNFSTGSITATTGSTNMAVGGLIGFATGTGNYINSYSNANVNLTATTSLGINYAGGFVGTLSSGTTLQSYATGNVSGTAASGGVVRIGGFVGDVSITATVNNAYSLGNVTINSTNSNSYAGGFASHNAVTNGITNSYSSGVITSNNAGPTVGGFLGANQANISSANDYWDSSTSPSVASGTGTTSGAGNVIGTAKTTAQMMQSAQFSGFTFDQPGVLSTYSIWYIFNGFTRPILKMENSSVVRNAHQLQLMEMNLGGDYVLANDIDTYNNFHNVSDIWGTNAGVSGAGFVPVSLSSGASFVGRLFGGNSQYAISNLYINSSSGSTVGLISSSSSGSVISNIGLINPVVSGQGTVGALVGDSSGTIYDSYASGGTVTGVSAGGLIGQISAGSIDRSYSSNNVSISTGNGGGLIGIFSSGTIAVSNSYATGNVTASNGTVGGFLGSTSSCSNCTLTNNYSTGALTLTGPGSAGGFAGFLNTGTTTLSNNFWDSTTAGASFNDSGTPGDVAGITKLTTTQALTLSTYTNWLISTGMTGPTPSNQPWFMTDGQTRPILSSEWQNNIRTAHQLQSMKAALGADYTLENNINLTSSLNNAKDIWATNGTSSGNGFSSTGIFAGTLDGENHIISNYYSKNGSLFGQMIGASAKNVGLENAVINVTGASGTVGGLVGTFGQRYDAGTVAKSYLNSVYTTGQITFTDNTSGSGTWYAGGLIGQGGQGVILSSYSLANVVNNSNVSATAAPNLGGLAGELTGSVSSGGTGNIMLTADSYSGGLVSQGSGSSVAGGFLGSQNQVIGTFNYWDTQTSGQASGISSGSITGSSPLTGRTTAQLQDTLPNGFSSFIFGQVGGDGSSANGSYPYLLNFYPNTPRVISGFTPSGSNNTAQLAYNGSNITPTYTGSNSFYYYLLSNGTVADSNPFIVYTTTGPAANLVALAPASGASTTGLNMSANTVTIGGGNTATISNTDLDTAGDSALSSNILYTVTSNNLVLNSSISLTTTANTTYNINGTITPASGNLGTILFNGPVLLGTNLTLNAGSNNITFGNTLNGAFSLIANTSGTTAFNGIAGGSAALTSITTDSSGGTNIGANITTSGAQTYNDAVNLTGDSTLQSNSSGDIHFSSTLDGGQALVVNTAGVSFFGAAVGGSSALTSLTTNSGGSTSIASNISTTGAQTFNDAVTLTGSGTFASSGSGNIGFASTLNGAFDLVFNTSGITSFGNVVGGSSALNSLTTNAGGSTSIGANITTVNAQTFNDAVNLTGNSTLANSSGDIQFNSTLNGGQALTVNSSGVTLFGAAIGGSSALASLTTNAGGSTSIASNISTTGAQTFNDAVTLTGPGTFASSGSGNIGFGSTLNGAFDLVLNTSGITSFGNVVGGSSALNSLTTNAGGSTSIGANITTVNAQT